MRYCLHERKSEKTGCTDERLAAQTKARTDPVRSDSLLLAFLARMRSSVYGNLGAKPLLSVLVAVNA